MGGRLGIAEQTQLFIDPAVAVDGAESCATSSDW